MNYKMTVYKTLLLITQVGIAVMVPIFFMLFISVFIKNKFGFDIVIITIVLGVIAGVRNAYLLIKGHLREDLEDFNK